MSEWVVGSVLILATLFVCGAAEAAEKADPLRLSVEEAALTALARNRDLRVRRLTPVIQGVFAEIARGRYDTEVFGETRFGKERSVEVARSTEERFDVEGDALISRLGVRQEFHTGTQVELDIVYDYSESSRTPAQHGARMGLTLTQSLLQGLGPRVNLAAIHQADLEVQAGYWELRGYIETILSQTEISYWRYVLAERQIAIFEESLSVASRQRVEIEQEIKVGTLAQTESAAACAEVALREQELIDARSELEQSKLRLLRLLGEDLDRSIVTTSDPKLEPVAIDDLDDRIKLAERSRAEINEAGLRLEQMRLETVVTRNGLLPRLDFFVRLGKTGFASDFSASFAHLGEDTYDVSAGLSFSYLIQNREAEASHRHALISRRKAELAMENLRDLVRLEVRLAVSEAERARKQIAAGRATRTLQEHKVLVEKQRFEVGESTALMLAQVQRDLLSSRIAEVKALVDYRNALVRLYLAEGSLMERRGMSLEK